MTGAEAFNRKPYQMRFTDIFIRRPVLAFVVSALILLVGAALAADAACAAIPAAHQYGRHRDDDLSGRHG